MTHKNNITFGIDENISEKITEVIKNSLDDFVNKLPNKYNQIVGERVLAI